MDRNSEIRDKIRQDPEWVVSRYVSLVEQVDVLRQGLKNWGELAAVICRDGGQYLDTHGHSETIRTCEGKVVFWWTEIKRLKGELKEAKAAIAPVLREANSKAGEDIMQPNWNLDAHIELTLTIAELRRLAQQDKKGGE